MDLRVLRYFLAVVREESIVGAAETLHLTQPTLSRQLKELEEEFGSKLFVRGTRSQKLTLTEKGMLLRRRAEEILSLAEKTEDEMTREDTEVAGDLTIGGGESAGMSVIADLMKNINGEYPNIKFHLYSGNAENVMERLERGLIDFGIFVGSVNLSRYNTLRLPGTDTWGILVREDSPLAEKESVKPEELRSEPLLVSGQDRLTMIADLLGADFSSFHVVATYNLLYNASLLVKAGIGSALCLDGIINTNGTALRFIPLEGADKIHLTIAWKKYEKMSRPAEVFLSKLRA